MKIIKRIDCIGFETWLIKDKYNVDCKDGEWLCDCSTLYKRKNTVCKHITYIKEMIKG